MLTSNKKVVQLLIDQCYLHGVRHVVISPGSRNAPFSISFDEHPDIKTYVIHDERSAAFFAMGIAEQLQEPVAICCTSGSAALNYFPAIAEAYYRSIPLIVITADRPAEWINQGDGQTIMQQNVFGEHVRYQVNLDDVHFSAELKWKYQRETALAFDRALSRWKGPIHFNVGLSEPLYQSVEKEEFFGRKIESVPTTIDWNEDFTDFISKAISDKKVMVLCGQLPKSVELLAALSEFSKRENVVVLAENTSNLSNDAFNQCIDRSLDTLNKNNEKDFKPEILITIGGAIVSKKIKSFLRNSAIQQHWKIGYDFPEMDTYQALTHLMQSDPSSFLTKLNEIKSTPSFTAYNNLWKSLDDKNHALSNAFNINSEKLTDIIVFKTILEKIPPCILHMSNSSVVRYCQLFDPKKNIEFRANRGTSGIDGSTSTAMGAAYSDPKQLHVFISGDVSFLYDSNALWNSYQAKNLKIIIVNNQGGGIFRIIPGASESKQLDVYFEAKHKQNAAKISEAFGWNYQSIELSTNLSADLTAFFASSKNNDKPELIEIFTDANQNAADLSLFTTYLTK
jgi:2-succinyl-5-enolpyruvyl-6-hydroxy-3-cyclohexene-1-carboxylate synthase